MSILKLLSIAIAMFSVIDAAPTSDSDTAIKFPIFFENGKIGVNFLGFHASAGLGGLITGNDADGGLQAEAGTPFGQKAWAGLGGRINGAGRSAGGLYAGATAGGGVGAKAGLGGNIGTEGSFGTSYAGASAGGLYKGRVKTIGQPSIQKTDVAPVVEKSNVQVVAKKENIQKIDKTVIVPTVKEVDVIVPTVKEVDVPSAAFNLDVRANVFATSSPPLPVYVEKRKYKLRRRPHRKQIFVTNEFIPTPPEPPVVAYHHEYIEEPAPVLVKKKIVTYGLNVPSPSINESEQLVGEFAERIDETPRKAVEIDNVGVNHGDLDLFKSISLKADVHKPIASLNFAASKQISINT